MSGLDAVAGGFDADQTHTLDGNVGIKYSHGVRAAADAGDDGVGLTAMLFLHLPDGFPADD